MGRSHHTATRLALALTGAGLALSGVVLLFRAAWIALSVPLGAMWASVILGGVLLLLGALALALAGGSGARRQHASDGALIVRLVTAFFQGLAAGRSSRDD